MGSKCCETERNYEKEILTLDSQISISKNSTLIKNSLRKELEFFSLKKQFNKLDSDLKKLLTKKFALIDENIKFEEITISEFENILNENIYYKRIITNLSDELNNIIFFEDDIVYNNIVPIRIFRDKKGNSQLYQGSFNSEGKAYGQGIWVKNNNFYFGNFYNDKFNGTGVFIDSKGNSYFGNWKNNQMEGKGRFIINGIESYKGFLRDNKKNGTGVENYNNYDVYYGEFFNNKKKGKGKYIFSNGDIYEGDFKNSKIEGKGKIKFKDGKIYEGDFKNGKMEGKGELIYDNGIRYIGGFIKNKKNGNGEYIWPDAKIFKGVWEKDIPKGKGNYEDIENNIFEEIVYKNGKINEN